MSELTGKETIEELIVRKAFNKLINEGMTKDQALYWTSRKYDLSIVEVQKLVGESVDTIGLLKE